MDYRKIHDLVSQIKRLKGVYCQESEKYDNNGQRLWKQVQKYEAEVEYTSKIRNIYQDEINELRDLETNFERLRSSILKKID